MESTLIDNSCTELSMMTALKECFKDERIDTVCIATGYWDIPGLRLVEDDVRSFLQRESTRLKLLIGKDPTIYAGQLKDPKYKGKDYPTDFIRTDIAELGIKDEYKSAIHLLLDYCTDSEDSKIQIRIFHKNEENIFQFLHSKCYIFDGKSKGVGFGIVGSSNFTEKGLCGNAELNYLETNVHKVLSNDYIPDHLSHIQWFNEKWTVADPWNKEFLEQVLEPTPIVKKVRKETEAVEVPFTPYEMYIKLLQIKFGNIIDKSVSEQIESYLPKDVFKLDYQIDAVNRCIGIMHEHGGFMLADVVGLGKTIVGALVIKRFLSVPEDDGRERKVLIITPPAIQSGWIETVKLFDRDSEEKMLPNIDYITTGRICNLTEDDEWDQGGWDDDDNGDSGEFDGTLPEKNYGLIIIDESHKFRNSNTRMYRSLDGLIQKIGSETGAYPYIGLLSATPQNNRPNDLKNQIYLFERNHLESTLKKAEGGNLERFFSLVNAEYSTLISNKGDISKDERKARLKAVSEKIRDCILNDILERRTRTDVQKYYKEDMGAQGIVFPAIVGPNNLEYVMDDELATLFYDSMQIVAPTYEERNQTDRYLQYYRYRAIEYFSDPKNEEKYKGRGNRGVKNVSDQLATIMQIMLVKRLESSFSAFKKSLLNLRRYTSNMIKMWENDTIFVCPQIDINKELDIEAKSIGKSLVTFEDCIDDIRHKIDVLNSTGRNERGQNAEYRRSDFRQDYIQLLKKDLALISNLYDRWANNSEDPKLDTFKENLRPELFNPQKNTSGKLVIFTEAIDTANALERAVKAKKYRVLTVTAANRNELEHTIQENFDANYAGEQKDDYDVLVTTEVLAEGVNLHRANVILNYDTPWNSTRLMQRIGRVNRIGSKEPFVYVYNFLPSAQGDREIQLVRKAYTKLQSFHTLFGEDSRIFLEEEDVAHYDLTNEVNGDESPLQKYIYELKQYKDTHPERYTKIEETDEGWQFASAEDGTAYFIVKSTHGARLSIRTERESEPKIISDLDILEEMKVGENVERRELPDNWDDLCKDAIKTYNQHFIRINNSRAGDRRTQALEIIVNLYHSTETEGSRNILKRARKLISKGNYDLIRKVLAIGKELEQQGGTMFSLSQEEIDAILESQIGKIVAKVEAKQGPATVIIGTMK